MYDKFVSINGEVLPATAMYLAIDLHEEGRIQFIAATMDSEDNRRKRWYHFHHNGKVMKVSTKTVRFYFLALINER